MSVLFETVYIGKMEVGNRFVRSATAESACDETGAVTDELLDMYRELAKGGTGLIITGHAYVQPNGRCSMGQIGIYEDELLPGLTKLASEAHKASPDCRIAVQIAHAGRQASRQNEGEIVAPSSVLGSKLTARAMTDEEIEECIGAFVDAAERVKLAGFDAVQLHSAHGYLISSFNSPYTNLRTDKWGGSLENRMRFLLETYRRTRAKLGDDYPIFVKMNAEDFLDGGIQVDESAQIARALAEEGIDAIEISGGMYESYPNKSFSRTGISKLEQEAYFFSNTAEVKKAVGAVPVMMVGGLRSVARMEEIIQDGKADFISLCRPLIREPDLPNRIMDGKEKADCISCNGCMTKRVGVLRCVQI